MRKFSSYGPIDSELHYHVPGQKLINEAMQQLLGDNPNKGGHYITIWAPVKLAKPGSCEKFSINFNKIPNLR